MKEKKRKEAFKSQFLRAIGDAHQYLRGCSFSPRRNIEGTSLTVVLSQRLEIAFEDTPHNRHLVVLLSDEGDYSFLGRAVTYAPVYICLHVYYRFPRVSGFFRIFREERLRRRFLARRKQKHLSTSGSVNLLFARITLVGSDPGHNPV